MSLVHRSADRAASGVEALHSVPFPMMVRVDRRDAKRLHRRVASMQRRVSLRPGR
ncbi:MAG TPA: hypothetical protein VF516_29385 [Kofleriaceae bacterium]